MRPFEGLQSSDCAVQLTSREAVAMMPARGGETAWQGSVELPAGAVQPALRGDGVDAGPLQAALRELVAGAPRRIGAVTLVLPDACAALRIVPIDAEEAPGKRAGEEILRWALRDALPFPQDEALIDTQLFDGHRPWHLLVAAAHRDTLRRFEDATAVVGPVVRTLPALLACGWMIDDEDGPHLVVHADDDALGCMIWSAGAPLFVRTRRLPSRAAALGAVIETLEFAVARLGTEPGRATVLGVLAGDDELEAALTARGWSLWHTPDAGDVPGARYGALAGALRAAEAGA
jgi:hypothetical protein